MNSFSQQFILSPIRRIFAVRVHKFQVFTNRGFLCFISFQLLREGMHLGDLTKRSSQIELSIVTWFLLAKMKQNRDWFWEKGSIVKLKKLSPHRS